VSTSGVQPTNLHTYTFTYLFIHVRYFVRLFVHCSWGLAWVQPLWR